MSPPSSLAGEHQEQGEIILEVNMPRWDPLSVSVLFQLFLPSPGCQEGSAVSLWGVALKARVKERLARKTIRVQTEEEGIRFQLDEKVPQERQN